MGLRGIVILLLTALFASPVYCQSLPVGNQLILGGKSAATWTQGPTTIVQIEGPVHIEIDRIKMSARRAVAWLAPVSERNLDIQSLQVALIGDAKVEQESSTRTGDNLFATAFVRGGGIKIVADVREPKDLSDSDLFREAQALRQAQGAATRAATQELTADEHATGAATQSASTRAATRSAAAKPAPNVPVQFASRNMETMQIDDGTVGVILTGDVKLIQQRPTGEFLELQANRVVLFTPLHSLRELNESKEKNRRISETVTGAYLEGDVRIEFTPVKKGMGEQRLLARQVFYDFTSDRAILTDAVLHTNDPTRGTPMVARAKIIRQLSFGEYSINNAQISSSSFSVPSLSLAADKLYIRQESSDNPEMGSRAVFQARGVTFQAFDVPFFYLPYASGSMDRGEAIRSLGFGNSSIYGAEVNTEFGLFETLGGLPPRDLDANYRLDYMSERGPGFGLNAAYGGGTLTDTTKQPWDFAGQFRSYFVYDHGTDNLGRLPARVDAGSDLRGMALWEHQHFFPDDWTMQLRAGFVSDATFLEQYFRRDFETGPPHDLMGYLKHQDQTEAFTLLVEEQPNGVVTTSNMQQEQFEVERLPEVQYIRVGDSLANDKLTFFTENRGGGMHFQTSRTPITQQGFLLPTFSPGIPQQGTTGITDDIVWRGDTRQEIDYPLSIGPFRAVPYVFGRLTGYSQQPSEPERLRAFVGAGARISTEIWKTDPTIESDLLDIHQLRHIIEPQLNLFTSATSVDNTHVYIYDEEVDKINDVSAIQVGLNQRWQTKRGGPGSWRSSDVFTFNVDVDWFANKPPKPVRKPYNFRGLFFESMPEASVPRDAINANGSWRISDNTVLLSDASWNLDKSEIQTMSLGILVRRDTRLSYFIGDRYIGDDNSNITSIHADYEISKKYIVSLDQEFDFIHGQDVSSSIALVRRFDTFYLIGRYFYDEVTRDNGFSINVLPLGFGGGVDTGAFQTYRR